MIIISIIGFLAVIFFGYLLVNLFLRDESVVEKITLGFIIGFGFYTFVLFLASLSGVKFKLFESGIILLLLIAMLILINKLLKRNIFVAFDLKKLFLKFKKEFYSLSLLGKISFIWIIILILSILLFDIYWPLRGYDAFVLYDFRTKSFIATGFMNDAISRGYFIVHPLMTSLSHTWLYLIGFNSPMFFYAFLYISFVVLFFVSLRKLLNSNISIILTALMFSFPDIYGQAQIAYTNLPYMIYLVLGSIYLYLGIKFNNNRLIFISMLLTILSGWTRSVEPFWIVNVIVILVYGIFRLRNLVVALAYAVGVYLFRLPWNRFYETHTGTILNLQSEIQSGSKTLIIGISQQLNIEKIFSYFYFYAIRPYFVLYLLLSLLIIYKIVQKSKDWWFFLIFFGYFSLLFIGTYVFTLSYSGWENIPGSFQRLVIFLIPTMIFVVGCFLNEFEAIIDQ